MDDKRGKRLNDLAITLSKYLMGAENAAKELLRVRKSVEESKGPQPSDIQGLISSLEDVVDDFTEIGLYGGYNFASTKLDTSMDNKKTASKLLAIAAKLLKSEHSASYANTLSLQIHLGGDPRNYVTSRSKDAPGWKEGVTQIVHRLKDIKTEHGSVDDVFVKKSVLQVYFEYSMDDQDAAFEDATAAVSEVLEDLTSKESHWAFILHGTADPGRDGSDLEIKDEAVESWGE